MRFGDAAGFALTSLKKRRLRTFLTAAGVTIGIGALVCMISFGKGMQKNVTEAFKSADLFNSIMVMPGGPSEAVGDPDEPGGRRAERAARTDAVLDDAAVAEILKVPGVLTAYPEINFPALVGLEGEEEFRLVQVVPAAVAASPAVRVKWGRTYTTDNEAGVVVSRSFARRLGAKDPAAVVGKTLRITSVSFDVGKLASLDLSKLFSGGGLPVAQEHYDLPILGVTEATAFGEGGPGLGQNDVFLPPGPARGIKRLPITSVWDVFRMTEGGLGYSAVSVKLGSLRDLEAVKSKVREMGFSTFALADQFEEVTKAFFFMDMILAAVGMIAIVVAALGIVNTMVMSILERFREIGVMKAVGGGEGDIMRIFFVEAGAIGVIGGAFGVALGWAVTRVGNVVVNHYLRREGLPPADLFDMPVWLVLGAVAFSLVVTLVAGLYPALRAARVDPVAALRHE